MKRISGAIITRTLLLFILSITFVLLMTLSWRDDSQEHAEVSAELIELKELDARLDRDVLRITSFLLTHYDTLVATTGRLKTLEKRMRIRSQNEYEELDAVMERYWQTMDDKFAVIERIKFQAAVVRNGIHYLPLAARQMKSVDPDIYRQALELLNELYVYDLSYTDSQLEKISEQLRNLEATQLTDPADQSRLQNLIFHIRANLNDLSELGVLKRRYLAIPTLENFERLHQRYEAHRIGEMRRKQLQILLLAGGVFGLLFGLWYLVRSLQRAHHALNRSWTRLHDAVESSSESFALFDSNKRLILFNRKHAEFYPWLRERLREGAWLADLKAMNSRYLQFFDMEGTPLERGPIQGQYLEKTVDGTWYLASDNPTSEGGLVCVRSDITGTKRSEADLRKLSRALEQSPASVMITSKEGRIEYVNPKFEEVSGYAASEAIGKSPSMLKSGDKSQEEYREMWRTLLAGKEWRGVFHNRRKDGSIYWESASISPLRDEHGRITHFIAVKEDITARKRAEDQLRMNATVFDTTSEGIMVTDAENCIKTVNPAFTRITGYEAEEVIGRKPNMLSSGRQSRSFYEELWSMVQQSGYWSGEIWNRRKDGTVYPEWLSIAAIRGDNGAIKEHVAVFSDITKHKQDEEKIRYQANFDALTGLPNRSLLTDRLAQAVLASNRENWKLALLFIDLDQFKVVNDTFGHVMGDELLQQVAERIRRCVREVDTVSRFGGDEFIILLQDIAGLEAAALVAGKVIDAVTRSFTLYEREIFIGASIGITIYPDDALNADALLRNADMAMYQAKERGRNNYQFFTASMQRQTLERQQLEQDLRHAIERGELELYYQPVIDVASEQAVSLEALLRWNHPKRGMVAPDLFIPLAENCGQIGAIGKWTIRAGCEQLARLRHRGHRQLALAVNLSSRQRELGFDAAWLGGVLQEYGLEGASLTLEITESLLMRDTEEAVAWLGSFKAIGVSLSVDDFGTGYSSLSYLKRFPVDALKIDRAFIHDLPRDTDNVSLVNTIIGMARGLKLKTVAEGVETLEQVGFLVTAGCNFLQGFYFAKPMPAKALMRWLEETVKIPANR